MVNQGDASAPFGEAETALNLSDLATRMVQRLLQLYARDDGEPDDGADEELQELLRRACHTAHRNGLHGEQFVIVLKEAWTRTPATARHGGAKVESAFNRLVTRCIEEFYGTA